MGDELSTADREEKALEKKLASEQASSADQHRTIVKKENELQKWHAKFEDVEASEARLQKQYDTLRADDSNSHKELAQLKARDTSLKGQLQEAQQEKHEVSERMQKFREAELSLLKSIETVPAK